ncbi:hypothetical protein P5V15_003168 [Pogonomyrmex californicus]
MFSDGQAEITFGNLETDERFKKLERSLKLALLKKGMQKGKALPVTTWPSISSINVDTLDSSCMTPSSQTSVIKSEVLASSNNLRNLLLKKSHNIAQDVMTTSSVKQYRTQQDNHMDRLIMPPPAGTMVYRTLKDSQDRIISNYEKAPSTSSKSIKSSIENTLSLTSTPSWISTNNTHTNQEHQNVLIASTTPVINNIRVFSKWKVMLNDRYELIIKGTLECGRIARSKPVIRRYSATCVESKYKHKYSLQGNIVDERNALPDYIRGKFYNGFPDDWENVYQIWRMYFSQGCPVTFRWPTPITDSDDDLKSELTDFTCARARINETVPSVESHKSNEYIKVEGLSNTTSGKEKCHNYFTQNSTNYKKSASPVKSLIFNSEKDIPVVQTKNVKSLCNEDIEQNVELNTSRSFASKKVIELKDIFQENKLNIIIKNLADRNCPPKYIDKIIEMFNCLEYVESYGTGSESNNNSLVNCEVSKLKTIPQSSLAHDNNCTSINKFKNKIEMKSYGHSTDLGYGSIKNDSNAVYLSNPVNIESGHDKDSDKSESETYAGIPKISIGRILKTRDATSRNIYKRKIKKKTTYSVSQEPTVNSIDAKKNLLPDESCISITEDEVETVKNGEHGKITNVQEPQEIIFLSHQKIQRNNFDEYEKSKFVKSAQNESLDALKAQRVNRNTFTKEQKIPYRIQNTRSQFITDVDYTTNSDIDIVTISTNSRKSGRNAAGSHAAGSNVDQNIMINNENNNVFLEKPCASPKLNDEKFVEQSKNETATKKSKPTIISSVPINLHLTISNAKLKTGQSRSSDVEIEDKQDTNIRSSEEADKKSMLKTKSAINDFQVCPKNKNEWNNIKPINTSPNLMATQPEDSKLGDEKNIKILMSWMPKIVYYRKSASELGLTFQGKLLNEVGHIMNRKFTTDIVLRRLSGTMIETVNHELYELLGPLNDNKHSIPRELVKQCRYGCPANIEKFCLTWKSLQHENVQEVKKKVHDTTMDSLNAPISSRGRRILPPLCYWRGERITLKDNNPIYSPGNSQESSLLSLTDNSKEIQKNIEDTEEKKKVNRKNISTKQNVNKKVLPSELNKISDTNKNSIRASEKSPKIKATDSVRLDNLRKSRKSVSSKRQIAQKLTFLSTDSSEEEQKMSPQKRMRNFRENKNANSETSPHYTMTLRKRQKVETRSSSRNMSKNYGAYAPKKRYDVTYLYYKDIPQTKDALSENEELSA